MQRLPRLVVGFLALASLAACADGPTAISARGGIDATKSHAVPFKGDVSGVVQVGIGPTNCPAGTAPAAVTSGGGNATHLGKFTVVSQTACLFATGTGGTQGAFTWRAANGDLLTGTFTFTSNPPDANGVVTLTSLSATITGGTGRFADASGQLHLAGGAFQLLSPTTFSFNVGLEGTINY
jgi:hypothetical protein